MTRPLLRLRDTHARIDRELLAERQRPRPDEARLARLKKLKLAMKDAMARTGPPPRPSFA